MKKIIKNSITIYIGFVIGIFISIVLINADNNLTASSINIDKTNMPGISGTTLNSALDYLYERVSRIGECPQGQICEIDFGGMFVYETASKTYEKIVYMDPTDLSRTCYDLNSDSITGTKTGCMKWYIYGRDNDGNYLTILDHNTTANQAWNTDGTYGANVPYEQSLVYPIVQKLTSTDTENGGSSWNTSLSPRLISAYEIADIVGKDGWTSSSEWFYLDSKNQEHQITIQGGSAYGWLYDNLGWDNDSCTNYGCNKYNTNNSAGYCTNTPYNNNNNMWYVTKHNSLGLQTSNYSSPGIRPVIEVSKTIFE